MKKKKRKKRISKQALSMALLCLFFAVYFPIKGYHFFSTNIAYQEGRIGHHEGAIISWDHKSFRTSKAHSSTIYYFQLDNGIRVSIYEDSAEKAGIEHRDMDNLVGIPLSFEYVVVSERSPYPLLSISDGDREIIPRSIPSSKWSGAVRNTTIISVILISLAGVSILVSFVWNAYPDWKRSWKRKKHKRKMQKIALDAKNNSDKTCKKGDGPLS